MTDPCACIVCDADEPYDDSGHEICVAGTERKCCECARVIELGEQYEAAWGGYFIDDDENLGDIDEYVTCLDCVSVIASFFCNGHLFHGVWEMLDDHLDEVVTFGDGVSSACLVPLTPRAREKVCDMIEERWDDDDDED